MHLIIRKYSSINCYSIILLIAFISLIRNIKCNQEFPFYNEADPIELLNDETFHVVLKSKKMSSVEFYANWCSYSRNFIPMWKRIARETLMWQKTVLRIAAIDCAKPNTAYFCGINSVWEFPQFKFFNVSTSNRYGLKAEDENSSLEQFLKRIIMLLEEQRRVPIENWPELHPYTGLLDDIFMHNADIKYAILILENNDSFLGRKIILDISPYMSDILVRRVIPKSNYKIFQQFQIQNDTEPVCYVITNDGDGKVLDDTLDNMLKDLNRDTVHNEVNEEFLRQEHGVEQESRYKLLEKIFTFIKYSDLEFDMNEADL